VIFTFLSVRAAYRTRLVCRAFNTLVATPASMCPTLHLDGYAHPSAYKTDMLDPSHLGKVAKISPVRLLLGSSHVQPRHLDRLVTSRLQHLELHDMGECSPPDIERFLVSVTPSLRSINIFDRMSNHEDHYLTSKIMNRASRLESITTERMHETWIMKCELIPSSLQELRMRETELTLTIFETLLRTLQTSQTKLKVLYVQVQQMTLPSFERMTEALDGIEQLSLHVTSTDTEHVLSPDMILLWTPHQRRALKKLLLDGIRMNWTSILHLTCTSDTHETAEVAADAEIADSDSDSAGTFTPGVSTCLESLTFLNVSERKFTFRESTHTPIVHAMMSCKNPALRHLGLADAELDIFMDLFKYACNLLYHLTSLEVNNTHHSTIFNMMSMLPRLTSLAFGFDCVMEDTDIAALALLERKWDTLKFDTYDLEPPDIALLLGLKPKRLVVRMGDDYSCEANDFALRDKCVAMGIACQFECPMDTDHEF